MKPSLGLILFLEHFVFSKASSKLNLLSFIKYPMTTAGDLKNLVNIETPF